MIQHDAPSPEKSWDPLAPPLVIEEVPGEDAIVIALKGAILHDVSIDLFDRLITICEKAGWGDVELKFEDVPVIDSQGIGVLCKLVTLLTQRSHKLSIINASEPIQRVLKLMRIDRMIEIK